ncbi:hypothetical protein ACXVUM_01200 [Williamsia sp. SKLECPSW1]
MTATASILATTVVLGTVVGVGVVPRLRPAPRLGGRLRHPGLWLGLVVAAMVVNQVLVTAYVHQEWRDDTSRITRYLPSGWFDMADLGRVSDVLPAWPWTVLHVQAALELPFVVLALLVVARWFGPAEFARLTAARWWISASFTATFCLIEWDLRNPYTMGDIVIRVIAGVVLPLLLPLLGAGDGRPRGLLVLAVSVGALGCLVLAGYDVLTLYNLGHVRRWLVPVIAAAAVLGVARRWAARSPARPGPVTACAIASLGWFVVVFAVPSLPVRYGFTFGTAWLSAAAGTVSVLVAVGLGWDRRRWRALCGAAALGGLGAIVGVVATSTLVEARLLAAAVGFVVGAAVACALADRRRPGEPRTDADSPAANTQRANRSRGGRGVPLRRW